MKFKDFILNESKLSSKDNELAKKIIKAEKSSINNPAYTQELKRSEKTLIKKYGKGWRSLIEEVNEDDFKNESVPEINNSGIGYIISYSLYLIAQIHVWHLLCPSGQKHMALGELYSELEDEVDELAERFIAQGGVLTDINEPIIAKYDDLTVMQKCQEYRNMVTSCVDYRPEMASIIDGVVDLQELIDNKLYKFKLN